MVRYWPSVPLWMGNVELFRQGFRALERVGVFVREFLHGSGYWGERVPSHKGPVVSRDVRARIAPARAGPWSPRTVRFDIRRYRCPPCHAVVQVLLRPSWRGTCGGCGRTVESSVVTPERVAWTLVSERTLRRWRERVMLAARVVLHMLSSLRIPALDGLVAAIGLDATRRALLLAFRPLAGVVGALAALVLLGKVLSGRQPRVRGPRGPRVRSGRGRRRLGCRRWPMRGAPAVGSHDATAPRCYTAAVRQRRGESQSGPKARSRRHRDRVQSRPDPAPRLSTASPVRASDGHMRGGEIPGLGPILSRFCRDPGLSRDNSPNSGS